jgi:GT2 family glycosyltransferase
VLPVYNHVRFLPAAIASVLAQTWGDYELVIVNDGSTDGTREYLDGISDPRIVVLHQENRRLPGALNTGFARARGELLTWTSADNHCAPIFLEALVGALDHQPDAGFAYSAFAGIDDESRITGVHRDQEVTVRSLLKQNPGIAAFLYRRSCQEAVGLYDPALDGAEDWDMWLRIVERTPAVYVPEVLYYYRLHGDSMTTTQREKIAGASRQVVRNAIARRGQLDIEELFPALADCRDRGEAELYACAEFGTALLQSPWGPPDLAAAFLDAACSVRPEPVALANYAIACGRLGRWDEVRRCLATLKNVAHTDVRRLVVALEAAATAERRELAAVLQPFGIDKAGVELFARERAARRVYSLTDPDAASDPAAPHGAHAATLAPTRAAPAAAAPRPASGSAHAPHASSNALPPPTVRTPTVSVIVPTVNRPDPLRTALQSILAQTYRDFEIVVVNDCGPDVQHVIDALDHEGRISTVRHAVNRGLAAARNSGLGVARGRFVAYLDDDDVFYPEHLETLVPFLEANPERVVYSDALRVVQVKDGATYKIVARDRPYSNDFARLRLLVTNQFPVLCALHTRAAWAAVGGFDESLTSHEDWDFWIRLSARLPFEHVGSITADFTHRLDGSSMTSSMRPDFLRTAEIIYARTEREAAAHPEVMRARAQFMANLRASVGTPTPAPVATPASASTSTPARNADPAATYDCSIVIPVFNRVELTEQCLVKLAAVTTDATFEVIVVDNGSTDGTADFLAKLGGDVQIIRNAENRGFAVACNQGARAARGRHVVFLNNDTIPLAGWLRPLLQELDADPTVAVVGSKLLYPDDTIQHAGVVFSREIPLPYHRLAHLPGTVPAVNRRRELQCVTGACMAVRRSVFDALGGFDEGYRNGFEDVDFCLRVGARGGRVIYQPASTLYHLESQTPGRKVSDESNGRRLMDRWAARWHRIGDEDVVLVEDGWSVDGDAGLERKLLRRIEDPADQTRWQNVARLQQALRADDAATAREMLTTRHDWPAGAGIAHWLERVGRLVGVAMERAPGALSAHA